MATSPSSSSSFSTSSSSALSRLWVSCQGCSKEFSSTAELSAHCKEAHAGLHQEVLSRSMSNQGLLSCRLCGVLMERSKDAVIAHCWDPHKTSLFQYMKQFPAGFQQSASDKAASAGALSLKCPRCPAMPVALRGAREFVAHFTAHHWKKGAMPSFGVVLGLVAEQLGGKGAASACGKCDAAVASDLMQAHLKNGCHGGEASNEAPVDLRGFRKSKIVVPSKETQVAQSNSAGKRAKLAKGQFAMVPCPVCNKQVTMANNRLRNHFKKHHPGHSWEEAKDRDMVAIAGLLTCQLCFTMRHRDTLLMRSHLKQSHDNMTMLDYQTQVGEQAFHQTESDKKASELLNKLRCPVPGCNETADVATMMTVDQLRKHLAKDHNMTKLSFAKQLSMVASQLGLKSCVRCRGIFSLSDEGKHLALCGKPTAAADADSVKPAIQEFNSKGETQKRKWKPRIQMAKDPHTMKRTRGEEGEIFKLSCPICGSMEETKKQMLKHIAAKHDVCGITEEYVDRLVDEKGLFGCRLCGTVRRAQAHDWKIHLKKSHGTDLSTYLSMTKDEQPFEMNESERGASAALSNIHCKRCDVGGFTGLFSYKRHLKEDHNLALTPPYGNSCRLIGQLSEQLGFASCDVCSNAVLKSKMAEHAKFHKESLDRKMNRSRVEDTDASSSTTEAQNSGQYPEETLDTRKKQRSVNDSNNNENVDEDDDDEFDVEYFLQASKRKADDPPHEIATRHCSVKIAKLTPNDLANYQKSSSNSFADNKEVPTKSLQDCLIELKLTLLMPRCPFCQERGPSMEKLRIHVQSDHMEDYQLWSQEAASSERRMLCGICAVEITADYDSLEAHLRDRHFSKSMDINVYLSEYEMSIVGHPKVDHPLLKRICPWCGQDFASMMDLRAHVDIDHPKEDDQEILDLLDSASRAKHFCRLCDAEVEMTLVDVEEHVERRHYLQMSRFLELFYSQVEEDWRGQVHGRSAQQMRSVKQEPEEESEPVARSSSGLERHQVLDVINLCSDDEDTKEEEEEEEEKVKYASPNFTVAETPVSTTNFRSASNGIMSNSSSTVDNITTPPIIQPQLQGCSYACPECKMGGFGSLSLAASHIERVHGGDIESFMALRKTRQEKITSCRICGKQIVSDNVEFGYHLWTEHNLPLEAYYKM